MYICMVFIKCNAGRYCDDRYERCKLYDVKSTNFRKNFELNFTF